MNEKKLNIKKSKDLKAYFSAKNNVENKDEFVIPYEAACSAEFQEGCILRDDEEE